MAENNSTLPAILERTPSKNSTRVVFTFPDKTYITFAVFYNRVELLSEFLLRNGIGKGDCVAIFDDQFINLPTIYFALARIGAITIPLLPSTPPEELEFLMKQNEIVAVFARPTYGQLFKSDRFPHLKFFINILSFRFESLQEESVSKKMEKQIGKIKKAAIELVKADELPTTPKIEADDEIQRLLLPDLKGEWQTYRYSHRNLISAAQTLTQCIGFDDRSKLLFLLPFYFNLTISLAVLGPSLKHYPVVFARLPKSLEELRSLLKETAPTHVLIESSLLETLLRAELTPLTQANTFLKKSKKFLSALRKKIMGDRWQFLKQSQWLICTNFMPPSLSLKRFLSEESVPASLLFGTYETTSALMIGAPVSSLSWIEGKVIKGLEVKLEAGAGQAGRLWVKGSFVLRAEHTKVHDGFTALPVLAEQQDQRLKILGFDSTVIKSGPGQLIDARVIETELRRFPEIEDVLIVQQNEQLILKVLPAPDFLLAHEADMEARLTARIQDFFSEYFHFPLEISRIHIEKHPFPKTLVGQKLRYLPTMK